MITAKQACEIHEKYLPEEEVQYGKLEIIERDIISCCKLCIRYIDVESTYINQKTQYYLTVLGYNLIFAKNNHGERILRISW
jgi:hypothetical protein